ncbi:MAG: hypothetical protein ACJ0DJ_07695 [bacterium]
MKKNIQKSIEFFRLNNSKTLFELGILAGKKKLWKNGIFYMFSVRYHHILHEKIANRVPSINIQVPLESFRL